MKSREGPYRSIEATAKQLSLGETWPHTMSVSSPRAVGGGREAEEEEKGVKRISDAQF